MKKYFITGLVILLPLALTLAIVIFVVNFLTQPFIGLVIDFLSKFDIITHGFLFLTSDQVIRYGSQLIILIGLFLFTLLLGVIARWFFFKTIINLSDRILHRIPLVNKVYKTSQEIIKTFFAKEKNTLRQVVMVPFPTKDIYVMGLISRESPRTCQEKTGNDLISIFVPTTPNPTTGFLLMYPKEQIIYLDLKAEDAIKYVVSCGVITPEHPQTPPTNT